LLGALSRQDAGSAAGNRSPVFASADGMEKLRVRRVVSGQAMRTLRGGKRRRDIGLAYKRNNVDVERCGRAPHRRDPKSPHKGCRHGWARIRACANFITLSLEKTRDISRR